MRDVEALRQKHPRFVYEAFHVVHTGDVLEFAFTFTLEPDIQFHPTLRIEGVEVDRWDTLEPAVQSNLAFHLGLAEVLSYWKAAASPEIVVKAGYLSPEQVAWWHGLLINGMGEYFFVNQIDFTVPDFVTFYVDHPPQDVALLQHEPLVDNVLIPVGGGKDSALTLDVIGHSAYNVGTLALNTTPAMDDSISQSTSTQTIYVKRRIDPKLLDLNAAGYLNGHTPFSSVVAFISVVSAILFGYRYIALSNERSSNEGNQFFHGQEVNHQYSKTFDFEHKFRTYCTTYIAPYIDYFSFLRPLYELQIARLFAELKRYHVVFRSCNVGRKTNSWCHNCSKCLFVYTMLYPFLNWDQLSKIFSHDLFTREDLLPIARELAGLADTKPFECVGTHEESRLAFALSAQKYLDRGDMLPFILQALRHEIGEGMMQDLPGRRRKLLHAWNIDHAIPHVFEDLLRVRLRDVVGEPV